MCHHMQQINNLSRPVAHFHITHLVQRHFCWAFDCRYLMTAWMLPLIVAAQQVILKINLIIKRSVTWLTVNDGQFPQRKYNGTSLLYCDKRQFCSLKYCNGTFPFIVMHRHQSLPLMIGARYWYYCLFCVHTCCATTNNTKATSLAVD